MKKQILAYLVFCIPSVFFAEDSSINTSINSFASRFYQESLAASGKNEIFSPYCLFNCLGMVYTGADLATENEMKQILGLDLSQEDLPNSLKQLTNSLSSSDGLFQFSNANSLWLGQNTFVLPSYKTTIENEFEASVTSLDFRNKEESAASINDWIKEQTRGTLKDVIGPQDISKTTQLMLVSALYFKGSWTKPFAIKNTHKETFYISPSDSKSISMMNQTGIFPYYENDQIQMLLLPFSGRSAADGQLACFFILPKTSLDEMGDLAISDWMTHATTDDVISVKIPRFELHPKYDLIPILSQLGMPSAFSPKANFSKMNGLLDLSIDKAIHETFFSLNEQGVTASAVTAISMGYTCIRLKQDSEISFEANRPFLFGIVDLKSNVMLFLGKMMEP